MPEHGNNMTDLIPPRRLSARRPLRTAAALVFACLFAPAVRADQILLKDGDRITGRIVKKDGPTLTVDSKNFGIVTLAWDAVASVSADPLHVVLPGDQTVKAALQSREGRLELTGPGAPPPVDPAEVLALRNDAEQKTYERYLRPGLLDLWSITGSLNIAGATGNAKTSTFTTPVQFLRASRSSRTTAYFNSIRSTATVDGVSAATARAVRGGWGHSRTLSGRLLANAFNDYEYDKFQSLDLRVVLGGGLGYQVWAREAGRLAAVAGVAWNRETFSPAQLPSFTRNSAEGYWGNDFNYKLSGRTSLSQSFRMFNNLTTTGEYRVNLDAGAATQLTRWLTWNVSLSNRYLSNPVPGRKNNDLLYTTGLGFTFAR
jgi:hypothetical protein